MMNNRKITIVVAVSKNGVIGKENKLIWNLPEDLKRFRKLTTNQVVVMGRKTHESIGKVLPNRLNVILSKNPQWNKPLGDNCVICYSIEEVLEKFKYRDLFIIGGEKIYEQFIEYVDFIEMTMIKKNFEGDAFFKYSTDSWKKINVTTHKNNDLTYQFITLQKIK